MTDTTWLITSIGIAAVIVIIGVLFVWQLRKNRKSGLPTNDERTDRIRGKAATYALIIGSYFSIALLFMLIIGDELYTIQDVDAGYLLIAVLLVYNVSFLVLRWFFGRKGE